MITKLPKVSVHYEALGSFMLYETYILLFLSRALMKIIVN